MQRWADLRCIVSNSAVYAKKSHSEWYIHYGFLFFVRWDSNQKPRMFSMAIFEHVRRPMWSSAPTMVAKTIIYRLIIKVYRWQWGKSTQKTKCFFVYSDAPKKLQYIGGCGTITTGKYNEGVD